MYYIYLHKKKTTGEIFYVGKGKGRRAFSRDNRNPFWYNVVEKHDFTVELVATDLQEWYAFELEKELISYYGKRSEGGILVNITDGGDGNGDYEFTDEDKLKISKANSGLANGRADKTVYKFLNLITNESFAGTRCEFQSKYNINIADLFKSKVSQVKNWTTICKMNNTKPINEVKNPVPNNAQTSLSL